MYSFDSRKIKPDDTFICLPGGEGFIDVALEKGAKEVVNMTREEMAVFSCEHFDFPSKKLVVIGVTGTNGKTTVAHLMHQFFLEQGLKSKLVGTIDSLLTTPESLDIQRAMSEHIKAGGTHFVMEVSSHGIAQHRVDGIEFDVKILTNITQDHLDFHKTFDAYKAVKLSFMAHWPGGVVDPEGYLDIQVPALKFLHGDFNTQNVQAAKRALLNLGYIEDLIDSFFEQAQPPKGRFEPIENDRGFFVFVDYAHTPDALDNVLKEGLKIAEKSKGRVLTLFGCGGERDRGKRSQMAVIAEKSSGCVVVTLDNPRHEDFDVIFNDIRQGFSSLNNVKEIKDRRAAILYILGEAVVGDVVIIAGKGHENYQIIGDNRLEFNDAVVAREWFSEGIN
jgi:UDP-N-acetylmuramoyl-L-alanyl-D-glutamate--2,6-diaminopimelate ligase